MRLVGLLLISLVALSSAYEQEEYSEEPMDEPGNGGDGDGTSVITTEVIVEQPVYEYNGVPLFYHVFHGYRVVDPSFYLTWDEPPRVHHASGRYFARFPIELKYDFDLPTPTDDVKWINFEPATIEIQMTEACGDLCNGLTVKVHKAPSGRYYLIFYCDSESICSRTVQYFIDSNPIAYRLFSFIEFTFTGTVDGSEYTLKKRPAPKPPVRPPRPPPAPVEPVCPPGGPDATDGLFRFERNRILLYSIQAKIGQSAYQTFLNRGNNNIPADRSLPRLYRSDALDDLASAIGRTGYTKMVAEMRAGGSMVAQVVFDVSNTAGLNKESWFNPSRAKSSHPFWIGNSGFNFFSLAGDPVWHRRFFINYVYPGCPNDHGFWVILEGSDACPWGRAHWTGAAPLLIYNGRGKGVSYQNGHAVSVADHFLVYLEGTGPDKLASASGCSAPAPAPISPVEPACPTGGLDTRDNFFRFERNKILLYSIQAKIGQSAYQTFLNRGNNNIPADRSLPRLYRSDALDDLASAIGRTGYTKMVAEMRAGGSMVAQVVFDVFNTAGLNKESWFNPSRVKSSHPFWIGNSGFNFFSLAGDPVWHRRFFINYVYPGCPNDHGFWVILEGSDACPWGRAHWTGAAPLLIYNGRGKGVSYQNGHAVSVADHFLVYLAGDGPDRLLTAAGCA